MGTTRSREQLFNDLKNDILMLNKRLEELQEMEKESNEGDSDTGAINIPQETQEFQRNEEAISRKQDKRDEINDSDRTQYDTNIQGKKNEQVNEDILNDSLLVSARINRNSNSSTDKEEFVITEAVEMASRKKKFIFFGANDMLYHGTSYCFIDSGVSKHYVKLTKDLSNTLKRQKLLLDLKNALKDKDNDTYQRKITEIYKIDEILGLDPFLSLQGKIESITEEFKKEDKVLKDDDIKKVVEDVIQSNMRSISDIENEISDSNKEIKDTYKYARPSSYSGYSIERRDWLGKKTNLSTVAKHIAITTSGLNEKNAIRLRMASGEYLELHLDKNGNLRHANENGEELSLESFSESIIPLTIKGSKETRLFTNRDRDNDLIYNNYEKVIEDLKTLSSLKINDIDYKEKIIYAMEYKLKQFNNKQQNIESNFAEKEKMRQKEQKNIVQGL